MSRLCGNSYDFASVASISVNLKCYKTAEGYEDTLHLTQRLSVAVQRGNVASVLGTAVDNYFVL